VKRDYYEVLGVPHDADQATITAAFHDLASDCHPDVADDPEADERFRDLAEAYSVLSKPEARDFYDQYGASGEGQTAFDEALADARVPGLGRGENVHLEIDLRDFEARNGTRHVVRYPVLVRCRACMGYGHIGSAEVDCDVCGGAGTVETDQRLRLRIPPGLQDEAQLRIRGEGDDAGAGSIRGDLLVHVHVLPTPKDPRFVRYAALVLLIVAIAALIVYLVH
jgi:DnaJ-class molecular chaperone